MLTPITTRNARSVKMVNSAVTDNLCISVGALHVVAPMSALVTVHITDSYFFNNTVLSKDNDGRAPAIMLPSYCNLTLLRNRFSCNVAEYQDGQPPIAVFFEQSLNITASGNTLDNQCPLWCPPGTVTRLFLFQCKGCPAGSVPSDLATCTLCNPGFYAEHPGQFSCVGCPNGTFTNKTGASMCNMCSPGSFSVGNATTCSTCPGFTYQDKTGESSCIPCSGRVSDSRMLCLPCDALTEGQGCSKLTYVAYIVIGCGGVGIVLLIIAVVVAIFKNKQADKKGKYSLVAQEDYHN